MTADHSQTCKRTCCPFLLVGLIALAACSQPEIAPPPPSHAEAAGAAKIRPSGPPPTRPYRVASSAVTQKARLVQLPATVIPVTAEPLGSPLVPQPEAMTTPANVVGHTLGDVWDILGAPALQRSNGAAQTWTYDYGGCSLELTSFYDVASGNFVVLSQHLSPTNANGCLGQKGI